MKSPLPEELGPTFQPDVHWCPCHLEPFRETWPTQAWVLATLGIFGECVRRDDIIKAAGADVRMIDRVLREYSPLCCLVGDDETARWTKLALGPIDDYKAAIEAQRRGN